MKVCIGYQSALEYWRICRVMPYDRTIGRRDLILPSALPAAKLARSSGLALPLHIMLKNPQYRWQSMEVVQHVFSGEMPAGCFIGAKNGFGISSPEFCFLQMAGILSLPKLIELGYELCGRYSLPTANDLNIPDNGYYSRPPLSSVKQLSAFIAHMPGFKGHKKAVRALRYILEDSASPMETKLAMVLTLPYKLGGFGLPKPELNAHIVPKKGNLRTTGKGFYACDLFWPDKKIAVEYDSNLFHTGSTHIANDSKKRNSLISMGITVITITTLQIYDVVELEKAARVIANCIGKRIAYKNPGFADAHNDLRRILQVESGWDQ